MNTINENERSTFEQGDLFCSSIRINGYRESGIRQLTKIGFYAHSRTQLPLARYQGRSLL